MNGIVINNWSFLISDTEPKTYSITGTLNDGSAFTVTSPIIRLFFLNGGLFAITESGDTYKLGRMNQNYYRNMKKMYANWDPDDYINNDFEDFTRVRHTRYGI